MNSSNWGPEIWKMMMPDAPMFEFCQHEKMDKDKLREFHSSHICKEFNKYDIARVMLSTGSTQEMAIYALCQHDGNVTCAILVLNEK